jgi:ribosomal protein S18 acetylase RimI-like enzyme
MINTQVYNDLRKPSSNEKTAIIDFLFTHLDEYGDPKADIEKCMNYALKLTPSFGGFILVAQNNSEIMGAVVVNHTGMGGYIPENILVYIAIDKRFRGKGLGKQLVDETLQLAKGDIALHVDADNPAKFLYEKKGFKNKYLEMRLKR